MKLIYCSHPYPLCSDLDAKREVTAEEVCSIHAQDIIHFRDITFIVFE